MPPLYLAFNLRLAANTKVTETRAITGTQATLDSIIWHRFRPNPTTTFAAWFHGDTPTPSRLDTGNDFITPLATFPTGIKSQSREILQVCRTVPPLARGLAIEIDNLLGAASQEVQVVYFLRP